MPDVLPPRTLVGVPSRGMGLCVLVSLVPTAFLGWPRDGSSWHPEDLLLGAVFVLPQLLAFLLSALTSPSGRTSTVLVATVPVAVSVMAVGAYLIGTLYLVQAVLGLTLAIRRA